MNAILNVMRREITGNFSTPVAYVYIVIFLVMTGVFTFYLGDFYERGIADLDPFFRAQLIVQVSHHKVFIFLASHSCRPPF